MVKYFPKLASAKEIIRYWKQQVSVYGNDTCVDFSSTIHMLNREKMRYVAQELFLEMKSEGLLPCCTTLSALMQCYADNRLFSHAQAIWEEIINSCCVPNMEVVSHMMNAYGKVGRFDEIIRILHEVVSRDCNLCSEACSSAISCFGGAGQLEMMEAILKKMASRGLTVDSATGNAFLRYYSIFGSVKAMEVANDCFKRSRILMEEEGIRAVAFAYINDRQFYKLGEFVTDVGLGRRNLLWNFLLLSYAANFKMKNLENGGGWIFS